jgi:hypothetical protein
LTLVTIVARTAVSTQQLDKNVPAAKDATMKVVLEMGPPTVVSAEGLQGGQLEKKNQSYKEAAIQKGSEPGSRGIAIVRSRYQATTSKDIAG